MENRRTKILAIDDNPDNLVTFRALISEALPDAEVFTTQTGQNGLEIAAAEEPDVILLDIVMPGMNGIEVCRRLKKDNVLHEIPVLFVTATRGDKDSRIQALEAGAEAFVAKPIDESEFFAQVSAMLKIRAANILKRDENKRLALLVDEKTAELRKAHSASIKLLEDLKIENEARKENETRFYSLFDHMSAGAAIYSVINDGKSGKDYIISDFNKAALRMENMEKSEVVGKSLFDLRPNIDEYGLIPVFRDVWKTGKSLHFPTKLYIDEKYHNWYENRVFRLSTGEIVAIFDDVTEKELANEQQLISEEKFRYFFDNSVVGKSLTLPSGELQVNKAMCEMLGFSAEELKRKKWQEITHPDDIEDTRKEMDMLLSGEKNAVHYEKRYIRKDGSSFWAVVHSSLRRSAESQPIYFMTSIIDSTERRKVEEKLIQSEEKHRRLFETIAQGILYQDTEGMIISANPAAERILDLIVVQMQGKTIMDLDWRSVREDGSLLPGAEYPAMIALRTGKPSGPIIFSIIRPQEKNRIWLSVMAIPLFHNEESTPYQAYSILQDITERKKAEEELHERDKLFANISSQVPGMLYQFVRMPDGTFSVPYSSLGISKIFGCSPEDVRNSFEPIFNTIIPEDQSIIIQTINESANTLSQWKCEYRVQVPGEPVKWVYGNSIPEKTTDGSIVWSGFTMDITDRKQTEKKLLASETRYRTLFEAAKDGILILDAETGMIEDVNPYLIELLGYTRDQFLNRSIWEIGFFQDIVANRDKFLELQEKGYVRYEDLPLHTNDGKQIDVEFVSNVYIVDKQKVIQCNIRDISARKKAESALVESELLYRTFVDACSDMIYLKDDRYIHIVANCRLADFFGREKEDVIGRNDFELMSNDAAKKCRQTDAEAILSKSIQISEESIGDRVYEAIKFPVKLADSKTGVGSFIRDVTERRQAEIEVKTAKEHLEKLIDSASAPIIVWDKDLMITRFNGAFETLTGRKAGNVIGKHLNILSPSVRVDDFMKTVVELYAEGSPKSREIDIIHTDGSIRTVIWNAAAIYDQNHSTPVATIVQGQDITDRSKAEKSLLHLSYHDQLTGLYNRRLFEEELVRIDTKENLPLSIIMCDINGLKLINDSFGHAFGDELLQKTARALLTGCRKEDVVARLGGDEFVVLMPKTDASHAEHIVDSIKNLIADEKVANMDISVSFGFDTKTSDDQKITETLANAENYMYRRKIYESSSMRSKAINIIMNTLFEKSPREMMHSKRVSEICEAIASELHYSKEDVNRIRLAGLVHDIGKIGIDEKILNKRGELTNDEWLEIKKHPEAGWRILSSTSEFAELAQYILEHQEKWDGTGYPKGLKGTAITKEARIIAISDAYDAMTSERTYRKCMSREDAVKEIKKCSGTQFDPDIVNALQSIIASNNGNFWVNGS